MPDEPEVPLPKVGRQYIRRPTLAGAVLLALFFVLPFDGRWWWLGALLGGVAVLLVGPLTFRVVNRVLQSHQPFKDAASALFLLLALLLSGFGTVFYLLGTHTDQIPAIQTRVDALYFTVVTLSTVGFGDITPTGQAARLLVTLQILFNLVFLGVAVRVVAGAAQQRRNSL